MKTKSTIFVLFAAFLFSLIPADVKAVDSQRYGSITTMSPEGFVINHGTLERKDYFSCSLSIISCTKIGDTYTDPIGLPTSAISHFYNIDKTKVLLSTASSNGYASTVYYLVNGKWQEQKTLPITFLPTKAYFSDDGSRLLIYANGKTTAVDLVTNTVVISRSFTPPAGYLTISPNGRYFAYFEAAKTSGTNTRAFVLYDLDKGRVSRASQKVNYWDLLSEETSLFSFSPDSKHFVYLDDRNGYSAPYIMETAKVTGKTFRGTQLITKKYTTGPFVFADNKTLYLVANKEHPLDWKLYKFSLTDKSMTPLANNASYENRLRKTAQGVLFFQVVNNSLIPVHYNENINQISEFKGLESSAKPTFAATVIRQPLLIGNLGAALLKPANYDASKKYPLLIWLHGGPFRQTSLGYHPWQSYAVYDWMLDEAVQSGAIVLKLDYRGSYGYGRTFSESLKNNVGKGDVADVEKAIKYMQQTQSVGNVYLIGNSYGGYLALRTLVTTPQTISGAISINGVTDWKVLLGNLQTSIFNTHFGGAPKKSNIKPYGQASIIDRIQNLTANNKVMIMQSEADKTIPQSQAYLLYNALEAAGKNVSLHTYPGEDHVFHKEFSMEDICENVLVFSGLSKQGRCDFE